LFNLNAIFVTHKTIYYENTKHKTQNTKHKTQNTKHKTQTLNFSFKAFTLALFLLMLGLNTVKAQTPSCDQCVENSSECAIQVKVTFYCNGIPVTNNGPVVIPGNTTQCFQHPFPGCNPCDMEVELFGVDLNPPLCPIAPAVNNKISMTNPGPVYPVVNPPCDVCFLNGVMMKYSGGLFMIVD